MKLYIFLIGLIMLNINLYSSDDIYMIKTKQANLRSAPSKNSKVVGVLYEYEDVKILKKTKGWLKIKTIDGKIGWVNSSVIGKVSDSENTKEEIVSQEKKSGINKQQSNNIDISQSQNKLEKSDNLPMIIPASSPSTSADKVAIDTQRDFSKYIKSKQETKFIENQRRRVIGEHTFPVTVLFPTPIPSARFGFSQGFGMLKGYYLYPYEDPDNGNITIEKQNINYAGFEERFDAGIVLSENISIDLNLGIQLSGGMENKDFITLNAMPEGDIRIGPNFSYKVNDNLILGFAPRIYYSKSIKVSAENAINNFLEFLDQKINSPDFENLINNVEDINDLFEVINSTYVSKFLKDAIPSFTKSLVINESSFGIAPSIGFAWTINKFWGVQGGIEYIRTKDKKENKVSGTDTSTDSCLNFNIANSLDFKNIIGFPLGGVLEFSRDNHNIPISNFGLGLYYQGIGDVQLGLFFSTTKMKKSNLVDLSEKFVQFNITYFF